MTDPMSGPIAYLTGEYPRATDTFIQREVAALRELGFQIDTFSIRRTGAEHIVGPEQRAEQARTFHVLSATARPLRFFRSQIGALRKPGRYLSALALAWKTAPKGLRGRLYNLIYFAEAVTLAQEMQDRGIVHLHNHIAKSSCSVAMLASELSGIPFSFTLHGPDIFFEPRHWRLDAKIARASFVACISEFCRSQAMLFSDRTHWDKLHIVHCGIDPSRYDGPPGGDGPILFVGRLASVKGIPVLLDAMSRVRKAHPRATLILIGDGPERPAIEAAVRADADLATAVTFAGYQSQEDVARHLATASMLVLPSFAEGVPVVLMEAMAAGKPVIASQVGGVAELVKDGVSGRLVPAGDDHALEAAITWLLADPTARQRMGEAGRKTVREDFASMEEAARLGILFVSYHANQPRPAKRPGRTGG
jgi:glycosyltransferase involved in cell wall biosynthesis